MGKVYKHWNQFPMSEWRWNNFTPQEIASKREGELMIDEDAMDKLQKLRNLVGKPLLITSAYRSEAHNKKVGGAPNSMHRQGKAFDVIMTNQSPHDFIKFARACGFTGIGQYPKSNFIHIDTGRARTWNDGSDFPLVNSPTPVFQTEPKVESITDILKKPETLTAGGAILTGAGAVSQGNGPVQWAFGVVLVLVVLAFFAWLVLRARQIPRDV